MMTSTPKTRNTWKNVMMMSSSHFFRYFLFWGREACQKYAVWVLVGCGIKFRIQRALPLRIWVKTQKDMSKIWTKKVVFFYDKYVNSTIMVDSFYWNSIGSSIPTHKNLFGTFSYKAHFRPQISSNSSLNICYSLMRQVTWLYAPYKTIETQIITTFFTLSYGAWRAFP